MQSFVYLGCYLCWMWLRSFRDGIIPQSVAYVVYQLYCHAFVDWFPIVLVNIIGTIKKELVHFCCGHFGNSDSDSMLLSFSHYSLNVWVICQHTTICPLTISGSIFPPADVSPGHITSAPPSTCLIAPLSHWIWVIMYGYLCSSFSNGTIGLSFGCTKRSSSLMKHRLDTPDELILQQSS